MSLYARLGRILYWGVWPGSWLYLRGSRRTRLLLVCGDEILVVNNWLGAGKWNLPGGGLHKGEDPVQGLRREVREETSIQLPPGNLRLLAEELYRIHGFRYQCNYFTAAVSRKPSSVHQRFEIIEVAWTKRADITAEHHGPDVIRALELLDSAP
jgi:8-oxo-dGTP pyrophosphatase MutT (NUDIX family)